MVTESVIAVAPHLSCIGGSKADLRYANERVEIYSPRNRESFHLRSSCVSEMHPQSTNLR
ncbi:MAG: hypothetical protein ACI9DG_001858 [Oleispira sp.]|jgi:hypothetical protein